MILKRQNTRVKNDRTTGKDSSSEQFITFGLERFRSTSTPAFAF